MAGLQEICDQLQTPRPFALLHPADLISRGAKADVIGEVIGARIDGEHVIARILVTETRGETAVADGMHELSLGYLSRLRDGKWQFDIHIDHLALVPRARCGSSCSLRADCASDSACSCINHAIGYTTETVADQPVIVPEDARYELPAVTFVSHPAVSLQDEASVLGAMSRYDQMAFVGPAVRKAAYHNIVARAHQLGINPAAFEKKHAGNLDQGIVMDELSKQLGEALANAAAQKARADQLDTELKGTKEALVKAEVAATNAQAALSGEKARADAAEEFSKVAINKAKLDADAGLSTAVRSRVALETQANRILGVVDSAGKPVDRSAVSDRDLKVAVIKHVDGMDVPADKVPAYIDGVYEGAVARSASASASVAAVRAAVELPRADAATRLPPADAERKARQDMADRKRNGKA